MKFLLRGLTLSLQLAVAWAGGACQSGTPRVALREHVEINQETICLADLLPPDAPLVLRTAGSAIELGLAPQPGSLRVWQAPQLVRKLAGQPALLSQILLPASITLRRAGWPIPRPAIASAIDSFLQQQGWRGSDLPDAHALVWTGAAARVANPALEVTAFEWDRRQAALQLQLRCVKRSDCGSFLVMAASPHPPPTAAPRTLTLEKLSSSQGARPELAAAAVSEPAAGRALTQPGDSATLILENDGIRISLAVVCLQRGFLRQEIRVRDAAGQRVYRAEVVGAGLLRAPL